jgi:hypothetical protein
LRLSQRHAWPFALVVRHASWLRSIVPSLNVSCSSGRSIRRTALVFGLAIAALTRVRDNGIEVMKACGLFEFVLLNTFGLTP